MKKMLVIITLLATVLGNSITANAAEKVIRYPYGEQDYIRIYELNEDGKYDPVDIFLPKEVADAWNDAWNEYIHMPSIDANKADIEQHYFNEKYNLDELWEKYNLDNY